MWKLVTPQLPVADVAEAQEYYRDVLGFEIGWTQPSFGAVHYGGTEIFFRRADRPEPPAWCCVRVENADQLYVVYRERGVEITEPIGDKPWGMREFTMRDPNGHFFRIGHSTRA